VNLQQILKLSTPSNGLVIHQQKVNTLNFVAKVIQVQELSTKCVYLVTDYTGESLEVQLWKSGVGAGDESGGDRHQQSMPTIIEDTYVRISGQPRFQPTLPMFIVAFKMIPITDYNEITVHLLEVMYTSLVLEKRKKDVQAGRVAPAVVGSMTGGGFGAQSGGQAGQQLRAPGMNEGQRIVLATIKSCTSPEGIGLQQIIDSNRSLSKDVIKKVVDFLANEGHVYTTIDDEHYKATDV